MTPIGRYGGAGALVGVLMLGGLTALKTAVGPGVAIAAEAPPSAAEAAGNTQRMRGVRYYALDPFVLPVIDKDEIAAEYVLSLVLELADPDKREQITARLPRLRHAYYQTLLRLITSRESEARMPTLELVKRRLLADTQRVVGKDIVASVLIHDVSRRTFKRD